ncbi:hypothetical protein [Microbacterium sp. KNMS]
MVAPTAGAFAKAIELAVGKIDRAGHAGEVLYRLVLPTGAAARDLVPAVGGGFRGMVRAAGSTKFAGQARLVPVATGGAGAMAAAGPLIATVGLAMAAEMLAQHQTNMKLDAIKNAVVGVQLHLDKQERAVLTTAEKQARKVAGYLLDQATLPVLNTANHAFGELDSLTNSYIERLDGWLEIAAMYADADRVYGPDLMKALVSNRENPIQAFERMVGQTYEALALRARVVVLEKIAAEFSNPDRSLPHVENVLRAELSGLAERQSQLVGLIDDLSTLQLDASKVPVAFAGQRTLSARTSFARLARALHSAPSGLPLFTDSDQTMLELAPSAQGLSVLEPAAL